MMTYITYDDKQENQNPVQLRERHPFKIRKRCLGQLSLREAVPAACRMDERPNSWAEVTFEGLSSSLQHLAQAGKLQGGDVFHIFPMKTAL